MNRLFVRTYLALVAVVVVALALAFAWGASRGPPTGGLVVVPADAPPAPGPPDRWIALEDGQQVRVRARFPPPPPPFPLIAAGVVLGLGVVVAWQLRPLDRQLARLADAARAFGEGRLDVRVRLPAASPIGELGARFDAMADRIGGLLQSRQNLLAAVSHELRSPLQRLRFATELLAGAEPADRERLAEGVQRDLDALDGLVGELLAWIRLDLDPAVQREPVALAPLLEAAAADAARLGTAVPVDCPQRMLRGDARLLRRAVDNLLANAVRHGRGRVALSAEALGAELAIRVDDDGPGIPPEARARVLEPFVRLDASRARDQGGVGLGLALVDGIARAHGGRVEISGSPLGGARVALILPLTNADAA